MNAYILSDKNSERQHKYVRLSFLEKLHLRSKKGLILLLKGLLLIQQYFIAIRERRAVPFQVLNYDCIGPKNELA